MLDRFTRKYSDRLGVLTGEQLQAALDRFQLGRLLETGVPGEGLFGQNVFLTTTRGRFVFRGAHFGHGCLAKEKFMAEQLAIHTKAPVPWPYLHEESTDLFGWDWVIMPRMPGLDPCDEKVAETLTAADRREIARAVGAMAAELHRLTWSTFGEYSGGERLVVPQAPDFATWTVDKIRGKVAQAREASAERNPDEDIAWVEGMIKQYESALVPPAKPTYVHHDYREGNLLVDRDGARWRVKGVFDLFEGYFGDGEEDLPRAFARYASCDLEAAEAFLCGYAANQSLRPGAMERFALYSLSDAMTFWSYGLQQNWHGEKGTLRDFVDEMQFEKRLSEFGKALEKAG